MIVVRAALFLRVLTKKKLKNCKKPIQEFLLNNKAIYEQLPEKVAKCINNNICAKFEQVGFSY